MDYLTLAMAKGRTAKQTISLLEKAGVQFPDFDEKTRKLIFYDQEMLIKLVYVKAIDVPTYVEKGAADIGIVGKDNIAEAQADIYDMMDLNFGKCKFVLAGTSNELHNQGRKLTIATKYPAVTREYFKRRGIPVETIKLNGSVELAPLIGLSDLIVDIVETGTTLKENGLKVMETIDAISTRLIVNKASFATKSASIHSFMNKLEQALEV
ncbi:ATP phosphoribosyltransferase [Virgibacillus oceani]|uniref:ATP phosphoribosyltransferase n=1 Tax=Virgibacillus oceani TaxID=1479511 RepID=A0A917HK42_9BACI|nr:ATP phosphoribosyltransferase [Virgibacillus oceani]GGG81537.1 ATP phosphoribosyltransferase [Virgibacillus oceani]